MKPIIGVMPLWDEQRESLWMLPGYLEGIKEQGGNPFVFPFTNNKEDLAQLIDMCDGILITGGQDVSTHLYKEEPIKEMGEICLRRDEMESIVLELAMKQNKPILGICRGIQFINACLGGTLYQDLNVQHPSTTIHRQKPPYDQPSHFVKIIKDSLLYSIVKEDRLAVNSCHHQAIKDLAPSLKTMAISEDGLIEAVYKPDYSYLVAVQWHPEFSYKVDKNSQFILSSFVEACKNQA